MSAIDSRIRTWLVWAMPFVVIAVVIGWETDWGRALTRVPALEAPVVPKPVNVALLPEYKVDGGIEGNRETVERTLSIRRAARRRRPSLPPRRRRCRRANSCSPARRSSTTRRRPSCAR